MKKQNERKIYLLSSLSLAIFYLLLRFPLLSLHGMKDWPGVLAIVGLIVVLFSALLKRKWIALGAAFGYPIGFLLGYLFKTDGLDLHGASTNTLWYLWMMVYLLFILSGLGLDLYLKFKEKKAQEI